MYCPKCGMAAFSSAQKYCTKCGASLEGGSAAAAPTPEKHIATSVVEPPYSGFWRRAAALFIDYLILYAAFFVIGLALAAVGGRSRGASFAQLLLLEMLIVPWLYFALMESSAAQASVGKLALGIKVTDLSGERVSFLRATGRYFAKIVSGVALGIGYVISAFTNRRQTLHDVIADTLVVHRRFTPDEVASAGPAPRVNPGIAVLIVVVVILCGPVGIGILAAIAIPAYQDYTIRAQVFEGLNAAAPYKAAVSDSVAQGQPLNTLTTEKVKMPEVGPWRFVSSIRVVSGVIEVTYGGKASNRIAGKRLLIAPATSEGQSIVWYCGHQAVPEGSVPVTNRDLSGYTTLPDKYLPRNCRSSP